MPLYHLIYIDDSFWFMINIVTSISYLFSRSALLFHLLKICEFSYEGVY